MSQQKKEYKKEYLAVNEFCRVAGISLSTEKRLRKNRRGPDFVRIPGGHGIRYARQAIDAWLQRITVRTQGEGK